jgi:hypothetical protein
VTRSYHKIQKNTILQPGMYIRYPVGEDRYLHFQLGNYRENFKAWEICRTQKDNQESKYVVFLSQKSTMIEKNVEIETRT